MDFQTIDLETDPRITRLSRGRKSKPIPQLWNDAAAALVSVGDRLDSVGQFSAAIVLGRILPAGTDRENAKLHGSRVAGIRKIVAAQRPGLFVQGRIVLVNGAPTYCARVEKIVPDVSGAPKNVLIDVDENDDETS